MQSKGEVCQAGEEVAYVAPGEGSQRCLMAGLQGPQAAGGGVGPSEGVFEVLACAGGDLGSGGEVWRWRGDGGGEGGYQEC